MIFVLDSLYVQIHPELRLLRWQWHGPMRPAMFQAAFDQLLTYAVQHGSTLMLADTTDMPPVGSDEQAWLSEVWLPRARCLGVRSAALLLPDSLHNQLVMENVVNDARYYLNVRVQFFSDTPSALDWLVGAAASVAAVEQEWQQGRQPDRQELQLLAQ